MLGHIQNMKLRARLLLSYAVIIIICLAASITALFMLNRIGNNLSSCGSPECHIRFGRGR